MGGERTVGKTLQVLLACLALAGCAGSAPSSQVSFPVEAGGSTLKVWATVYKPDGQGPFPGVVVLHHCGGIDPELQRWARHLTTLGYVAIVPDSFGSRGTTGVCANGAVRSADRVPDAYAAAAYLRTLPDVQGDRIGLIGFSHGGGTIAALAAARQPAGQPFAAAVAYYPGCPASARTALIPTLVLVGEKDDWTPAPPCQKWAERVGDPNRLDVVVYPGATHRFDYINATDAVGQRQVVHHNRYDAAASADANGRAEAFLARWLKR